MNAVRKNLPTFFFRYIFTNLLTMFLLGLSMAEGTERYDETRSVEVSVTAIEFENVDFPAAVSRVSLGSSQSREMSLPLYYLRKEPLDLFHSINAVQCKGCFASEVLDQIRKIVSLVICSNAP
ncbi:hypothetical protein [Cyclobacterium jeungdonense]|uniref:Uncharacterized protein n=1 Tax=Cyclobacterium jeungdonense TaxID=708087 RepID=A0ABT8CCK9_9BACT|nr:hypothetical protein [Cyclobacterium jeungdonense]MDN3689293.1 hypothetical protein [Cyclobacterium jeungdonense]